VELCRRAWSILRSGTHWLRGAERLVLKFHLHIRTSEQRCALRGAPVVIIIVPEEIRVEMVLQAVFLTIITVWWRWRNCILRSVCRRGSFWSSESKRQKRSGAGRL
jgi:hypothetical protein